MTKLIGSLAALRFSRISSASFPDFAAHSAANK
jgi:hypothetical protein